jgi:uncharacterized RDD family membrane protein YckC
MSAGNPSTGAAAPGLARRLASLMYEGVVLFGVVFVAGYLYSSLTQQRHALQGMHGLQAFLFVVLGIYFIWFWTHSGQTVAMKAWHLRLVDQAGQPLKQGRALGRYVLSWLWFVPGLLAVWGFKLDGAGPIFGALLGGMLAYALLAWLLPQRQFLHDRLCGTRIVTHRPAPRHKAA